MVFLVNFIAVFIYYYLIRFSFRDKEVSDKVFLWIVTIHAIIFRIITCPWEVDDAERYIDAYLDISDMSFKDAFLSLNYYTSWGQGYVLLNWLLSIISDKAIWLYVIVSIISVGGVMSFYNKTSYVLLVTISMYLIDPMMYHLGFGVLRQHLAVVFVLFALYYCDNWKRSVLLTLIGVSVHSSALIFLPFLIWNVLFKNNIKSFIFYLYTLIIVIVAHVFIAVIISFLPRYVEVLEVSEKTNNIVPLVLLSSLVFLFYVFKIADKIDNERDLNILGFTIYGVFISLLGLGIPGAGRLTLFNIYTLPVALTLIYNYIPEFKRVANMYYYVFIIFCFYLISLSVKTGEGAYTFNFLWDKLNVF